MLAGRLIKIRERIVVMIIGVPKEIKKNEHRVAITPSSAETITRHGHKVLVEPGAGNGSGFTDDQYVESGAELTVRDLLYNKCDMLVKVKEIEEAEYPLLREGQIVFAYLHSNAHRDMTEALLAKGVIGIACEDIDDAGGSFPLLAPASILAGKGAFLAALHYTQSIYGGPGVLLSRVAGVPTPRIAIIGCGWSGMGAAELAASFGNRVTMLDVSKAALERAKNQLPPNAEFLFSNRSNLVDCLRDCDVLINCILWDKTRKDHLVNREDLRLMKPSAMIVDVACDEGGAIETCRSTSHGDPVYREEGILHYCVDNIPSAFSKTASVTFSAECLPFILAIANKGVKTALLEDSHLRRGLSFYYGSLTLLETAEKLAIKYVDALEAIRMSE
ncbi:MAG: alanine dehydrogenase [Clostridiales bacterium]|nr:alanine dehydrogenase [Clostridiales bacterium]